MFRRFLRYRLFLPFCQKFLWPAATKYSFIAAIYFCFVDKSFRREFQATIAGKLENYSRNKMRTANAFLLRRNTHRLEKGLVMRPRREVFATDYILQTVECFSCLPVEKDPLLWSWSHDVLMEYFSKTAAAPSTDAARNMFSTLSCKYNACNRPDEERMIPYYVQKKSDISWDQLRQLALDRRAIRWFKDCKVDHALIEKAMEVALLSPSACNRQPFRYLVLDDPKSVTAVATIPDGTAGFVHNIPMVIAIIGQLDAYALEQDRHVIYIDGALSAMSFMFALETLGLSSCPINWPDSAGNDAKMQKLFGLSLYERTIMLLAVGYQDANGLVPRSVKKSFRQVVELNPLLRV